MAAKNQTPADEQGTAQQAQNEAVTDAQLDRMASDTGEELSNQPTKTVRFFQRAPNEDQLPDVVVSVNGYVYQLRRGEDVEVPESVYNVIEDGRAAGREDLY